MANFRLQNGMYLRVMKDTPPVKKGEVYQVVLNTGMLGASMRFIGVNAEFPIKTAAMWCEPVYPGSSGNPSEIPNSSKEDLDYYKTYRIVGTFLELAKAKEELQKAIEQIDKIMINTGDIPHA